MACRPISITLLSITLRQMEFLVKRSEWLMVHAALGALLVIASSSAFADTPFYAGKRLTVMINYSAGGPADIEGRLFAKHLAKHVAGNPNVIVQNVDGAGGLIGATYLGEVAPKDGTVMGHLTSVAWRWANDPHRFRVDFKSYEFIGYLTSTTVYYARTDVAPGLKVPTDIAKATNLVSGGLGPDNGKDLLIRLGLEMLGVPHRHVTSYRSSPAARLALQQGEISFYSESPPSYRALIHPGIVKDGLALPIWYDPEFNDGQPGPSKQVADLGIPAYHELFQAIKGRAPSGDLWDAFRTIRAISGTMLRILALPPGAPKAAADALSLAVAKLNDDPEYAEEATKVIGFVPEYTTGPDTNRQVREGLTVKPEFKAFIADYVKKGGR
jgi:tripartite-type tricarboxylate transporter receptor subunit TctC